MVGEFGNIFRTIKLDKNDQNAFETIWKWNDVFLKSNGNSTSIHKVISERTFKIAIAYSQDRTGKLIEDLTKQDIYDPAWQCYRNCWLRTHRGGTWKQ